MEEISAKLHRRRRRMGSMLTWTNQNCSGVIILLCKFCVAPGPWLVLRLARGARGARGAFDSSYDSHSFRLC